MSEFSFFALRHKASQLFMPEFENGRGYSYWSPQPGLPSTIGVDGALAGSIRLFPTTKGADNARVAWAKGIHERGYTRTDGVFGPDDHDWVKARDVGRKKDDLEIVQCAVVLVSDRQEALQHADELEKAVMEVANGKRKPGKLPLEPITRLVQYARTHSLHPAILKA